MQPVECPDELSAHIQPEVIADLSFSAQASAVPGNVEYHREGWTVFTVEELLACHSEPERFVIRKQAGNAIDVALADAMMEAEADNG